MSVAERVLLLHAGSLGHAAALLRTHDRLHLGAVDQARDVRVRNQIRGQQEVLLERARCSGAAVDGIESGERGGSPHDEPAKVSAGCELQQIQSKHTACLHARDVPECLDQILAILIRVIDNQRSAALAVTTATELAFTGPEFTRLADFCDVWTSTDGFEELEGCFRLGEGEAFGGDYEGDFGDGGDAVPAGLQERRDR